MENEKMRPNPLREETIRSFEKVLNNIDDPDMKNLIQRWLSIWENEKRECQQHHEVKNEKDKISTD